MLIKKEMTPEEIDDKGCYLPYSIQIPGADQDLILANCPFHGEKAYFTKVRGDIYQCAHRDHAGGAHQQIDCLPSASLRS